MIEEARPAMSHESDHVRERYRRRAEAGADARYDPLDPAVSMVDQEKERAVIRVVNTCGLRPVQEKRLLEIGCGSGSNLLQLIRLGFRPENLVGNELLSERAREARHRLPAATEIILGDASEIPIEPASFDVVYQSTVFTSLLDDAFQQKLAGRMWSLVKPGGGILWYDFTYNNPNNPDVRGVPLRRVRQLFPEGHVRAWRLTLAPPIGRRLAAFHPMLYSLANTMPFLKTHVLCWIEKPGGGSA